MAKDSSILNRSHLTCVAVCDCSCYSLQHQRVLTFAVYIRCRVVLDISKYFKCRKRPFKGANVLSIAQHDDDNVLLCFVWRRVSDPVPLNGTIRPVIKG